MASVTLKKTSEPLAILSYDSETNIRYKWIDNEIWICAKDLHEPLGCTASTIRNHSASIPDHWKGVLKSDTPGGVQNLIFIHRKGVLKLLMKMRARKNSPVDVFQNWCIEKLDELIRTGKTQIEPPQPEPTAITWEERKYKMECAMKLEKSQNALVVSAAYDYQINFLKGTDQHQDHYDTASLISMAQLTDPNNIAVGRFLSAVYKKLTGEKPPKAEKNVNGSMRPCNVYLKEWTPKLIEALQKKYTHS